MSTIPTTGRTAPAANSRQRQWMLAALHDADLLLPDDVAARSLATMARHRWVEAVPADNGNDRVRHRLTESGRFALLTAAKARALMSVTVARKAGLVDTETPWPTLKALVSDGLVTYLTDRGERGARGQDHHPFITNLGRRLISLPEVDENPASQTLTAAFTERGIVVEVEHDDSGNNHVVYRRGDVEAHFYRCIWGPAMTTHSATHPAWMHDTSWYGWINHAGDRREIILPEGTGLAAESKRMAELFASWLAANTGHRN
ncbi:hypothetical protein [Streptomyces europaeiscabiei]|uniref:hypothetical protein n=1 Tax=Streptomyces europaeiscabiei TaxID=146819 RepID=UPI0038F697A6